MDIKTLFVKKIINHILVVVLMFLPIINVAQDLKGELFYHSNQVVKVVGYDGFTTIGLGKSIIDSDGNFNIALVDNYKGMAYLETSDYSHLFLVLNEPNIVIQGTHLNEPDSITFKNSLENIVFAQYAVEHNQREAALAGWKYLLPIYQSADVLKADEDKVAEIQTEINRLENQDSKYLESIDKSTYVSWFLPLRKLVDDMPLSTQRYVDRIPKHIQDFRSIDFNDKRLYHSGILDDLLEGHFLMLENMGQPLDSVFNQMNLSIDYILTNLESNKNLRDEIADFIFELCEKRSLFSSSEYLALKLLVNDSIQVGTDLSDKLEIYRSMKVGNIAPEIDFSQGQLVGVQDDKAIGSLGDLNADYYLLVFGTGSCPQCTSETSKLKMNYNKWKKKKLEILYISLETDKELFNKSSTPMPWISYCDFKGWESKPSKDYHVFGTPTMFLINKERRIIIRPSSTEHMDAWVNQNL